MDCNVCGRNFLSLQALTTHLKKFHKQESRCRFCDIVLTPENRGSRQYAYCDGCKKDKRLDNYGRTLEEKQLDERRRREKLRDSAFEVYGKVCSCCGEDNTRFLTVDHINNDGNTHRKSGEFTDIYRWLKKTGYPEGFQILCFNCNCGKSLNGGVCPHLTH